MQMDRDGERDNAKMQWKEMRGPRCTICEDLYVVAVLTSTAALGSIAPAAREGRQERRCFDCSVLNDEKEDIQTVFEAAAVWKLSTILFQLSRIFSAFCYSFHFHHSWESKEWEKMSCFCITSCNFREDRGCLFLWVCDRHRLAGHGGCLHGTR